MNRLGSPPVSASHGLGREAGTLEWFGDCRLSKKSPAGTFGQYKEDCICKWRPVMHSSEAPLGGKRSNLPTEDGVEVVGRIRVSS
jgi:hypothetical protein